MKRFPWLLFLPLALLLSACRKEESSHAGGTNAPTAAAEAEAEEVPTTYEVRGVVRKVNADRNQLVVKHEEIPGVMRAMTMMFKVDPQVAAAAKVGQALTAQMSRVNNEWRLDDVKFAK